MKILLLGTGGPAGWPEPGCGCASCARLRPGHRRPAEVVLDDRVRLPAPGHLPPRHEGHVLPRHEEHEGYVFAVTPDGHAVTGPDGGRLLWAAPAAPPETTCGPATGRTSTTTREPDRGPGHEPGRAPACDAADGPLSGTSCPSGIANSSDTANLSGTANPSDTACPDCARSHCDTAYSGDTRYPGDAACPGDTAYDVVLIDVPHRPDRLGALRRRGLVTDRTRVVAVGLDHRVRSEAELRRLLALWGAQAVPDGAVLDTGTPPPTRPAPPRRTLLLGGSGSGKSAEAELRLAAEPHVTYVATGPAGGDDPEWRARVRAHQERRPAWWRTVETTDLAGVLGSATTPLLIDGLGTWLAAVFDACDAWAHDEPGGGAAARVADACAELVAAWRRVRVPVVAVSDEVGLGVVPATPSGRRFRDALGRLNQRLAAESEDVALVVAGRLLRPLS